MKNAIVKQIRFKEDARDKIIEGARQLAEAVESTMGAAGLCVLLEDENGRPVITKDGVSVARQVTLLDPVENMGATLLKQAAEATVSKAGDGTSTATCLAYAILKEAMKESITARELKEGIETATERVLNKLEKLSIPVEGDMINQVAAISANNDTSLGDIIANAFKGVGDTGIVRMDITTDPESSYEIIDGTVYDKGAINSLFYTDKFKGETIYDNPDILIVENTVSDMRRLIPVIEHSLKVSKKPLVLIGDWSSDILSNLALNFQKGQLKVMPLGLPDYGPWQKEQIHDLSLILGATVINEDLGDDLDGLQPEYLGTCSKIIVNSEETIFQTDNENPELDDLVANLTNDLASATDAIKVIRLEKRLARLTGKVGVVRVGAESSVELKETADRVEDAICATKAALKEGVLPGGGTALNFCAETIKPRNNGEAVLLRAIRAPYVQILTNADLPVDYKPKRKGYGLDAITGKPVDMVKSGILDPTAVTKAALKNAASVAATILTTDCVINNLRLEEYEGAR